MRASEGQAPDAVDRRTAGCDGVNVVGYLRTESGVGAAVRSYVRALRALGVPHALVDVSALSGNRAEDRTLAIDDAARLYGVNLVCADVELHFALMTRLGEELFRDRYNVGIWAWELPRFPERWLDRLAYYDEIWVGTSFIANSLAPVSPVPVVRVPPVLTPEAIGSRERGRARLGAGPDEQLYLFVFDFHSRVERKNPLAVVEAFRRAFAPSDRAQLVLKSVNGGAHPEGMAALRAAAAGQRVELLDGYWPGGEVRDLMAACDVYVSLHRAEGTGLTISDAMALGKPVIATGWSGNADFMDVSNSFPVRYELVEIERGAGQYRAGETWAEPSVAHAAELMRQLFDDPALAAARGRAARRSIEAGYSEARIADLIRARLEVIGRHDRLAALRRELRGGVDEVEPFLAAFAELGSYLPSKHLRYQRLIGQIRAAVRAAVPAGAAVAVVSRGDEALLELGGRPAWHLPQTEEGLYAGHHPADGPAAVAALEALRARGAGYLLLPATAGWWLEHYPELRDHLARRCQPVWSDDACRIYRLAPARADA